MFFGSSSKESTSRWAASRSGVNLPSKQPNGQVLQQEVMKGLRTGISSTTQKVSAFVKLEDYLLHNGTSKQEPTRNCLLAINKQESMIRNMNYNASLIEKALKSASSSSLQALNV